MAELNSVARFFLSDLNMAVQVTSITVTALVICICVIVFAFHAFRR